MSTLLRILRRAKLWSKILTGKEILERLDVRIPTVKFGAGYGAWDVSIAGLTPESVVYAFGVGEEVSFDLGLIDAVGCVVHAFDPTPKSLAWARQNVRNEKFVLHEYGLAGFDGNVSFNPPEDQRHVSYTLLDRPQTMDNAVTLPVKRLSTIMRELGHSHVDVLKMDVEGAEYDIIADLAASAIRPKQILVEFHHRFPNVGVAKTRQAIATLRKMGYRLYALAASNEEYSFVHQPN